MNFEKMMEQALADEMESKIAEHESGYRGASKVFTQRDATEMKHIFDTEPERLLLDPYFLNLDGFIYPAVMDDLLDLLHERKKRHINLAIFLEGIGCFVFKSVLYTNRGLVRIGDLVSDSAPLDEFTEIMTPLKVGTQNGPKAVTKVYKTSKREGRKIKLRGGYELGGTLNHPIKVLSPEGPVWKPMGRLELEDQVGVYIGEVPYGSDDTYTEGQAYLIGYALGDGYLYIRKAHIKVDPKTPQVRDMLIDRAIQEGLGAQWGFAKNGNYLVKLTWDNWPIELRGVVREKAVPDKILKSPKPVIAAFIRGLWDADGTVNKKGHIHFSSVNPELINMLRTLLAGFGIISGTTTTDMKWRGELRRRWNLYVLSDFAHRFFAEIGFDIEYKNDRKIFLKEKGTVRSSYDTFAGIHPLIYQVYHSSNNGKAEGVKEFGSIARGNRVPSRNRLQEFLQTASDTTAIKEWLMLHKLVNDPVVWLPVKEIEKIEDHFYDLHVPDGNEYCANNLIVHNSGKTVKSSALLWLQWFELSCHIDPQAHFGLIPGSVIAFMTMNRTEVQARRVTFSEVMARFQTPFNKDFFPPAPRYSKEIRIEQNNTVIFPGTSTALSALGYNAYGGCLTLDTNIWVKNQSGTYELVPLGSLVSRKNIPILSLNPESGEVIEVIASRYQDQGDQEVYELETGDGTVIRATKDHKFIINKEEGWKELRKINGPSWRKKLSGKQRVADLVNAGPYYNFLIEDSKIPAHNCIDEACFLEVVEDSKRNDGGTESGTYDAAEDMHNAMLNRMTSRFMKGGIIPGILVMFSSPRYPEDFLNRKIREADQLGDESGVFYRIRPTWSAKGTLYYPSKEYFYIDTETLDEVPEEEALSSPEYLILDPDEKAVIELAGLTDIASIPAEVLKIVRKMSFNTSKTDKAVIKQMSTILAAHGQGDPDTKVELRPLKHRVKFKVENDRYKAQTRVHIQPGSDAFFDQLMRNKKIAQKPVIN